MARVAETLESYHAQMKKANSYAHARSSLRIPRARDSDTRTDLFINVILRKRFMCTSVKAKLV